MSKYAFFFVSLCIASAVFAQSPGVTVNIQSKSIEVGEPVLVQLVCTNTGVPSAPQVVARENLEIQLLNPNPSQRSMVSIVNGRRTERATYTYFLSLTASKAGSYEVGPFTVTADGREYTTDTTNVFVREPTIKPKSESLVFVELEVFPDAVYVTQTYRATLKLYIREFTQRGQVVDIDLIRNVLDLERSKFGIFLDVIRQRQGTYRQTWLTDSDGERHAYKVFHFTVDFVAADPGQAQIGPIFARVNYPTAVRRNIWGELTVVDAERATARADAIIVVVKAPPENGKPADYVGAIGRYDMNVSAKPQRIELGEPVTITIELQGDPIAGAPGPDLSLQPELVSRFDFTREELVGELQDDAKVFRKAVFPKREGEQTIPPLSMSYFDPVEEAYVTLRSDALDIVVDPPSKQLGAIQLTDGTEAKPESETLTVLSGGIMPNYANASRLVASQQFLLTPVWAATLCFPPAVYLLVTFITLRRKRLSTDPAYARRRQAHGVAKEMLQEARRSSVSADKIHKTGQAVGRFVADWLNLPTGHLACEELNARFMEFGIKDKTRTMVVDFIRECEQASYAGMGGAEEEANRLIDRAESIIKEVAKS